MDLISHLHRGDVSFDGYMAGMQQSAIRTGSSAADAGQHALAQLQQMVDAQANVLALISAFFVLGVIVALLVPLPFLMKRQSPEEMAESQGMH